MVSLLYNEWLITKWLRKGRRDLEHPLRWWHQQAGGNRSTQECFARGCVSGAEVRAGKGWTAGEKTGKQYPQPEMRVALCLKNRSHLTTE